MNVRDEMSGCSRLRGHSGGLLCAERALQVAWLARCGFGLLGWLAKLLGCLVCTKWVILFGSAELVEVS